MRCSSCGTENEAGRKFCGECGTALLGALPGLRRREPADGQRFCGECGTALRGERRPSPAPVRPSPRARSPSGASSSVLFADLVGFTPFAEERDAEDVRELAHPLLRPRARRHRPLRRHGREVHRRRGHGRLGRADRARGRRRARGPGRPRARRRGPRPSGPAIQARAGVLTGEAAVTLGATNQGMVAGDLVNTAARLQSVGATRAPSSSARRPQRAASERDRLRAGRRAGAQGQGRRRSRRGARCASSPSAAAATAARRSRRRSSAATTSCGCSRTCSTPPSRERRARLVSVIGPGRASARRRLAWEFLKYLDGLVEHGLVARGPVARPTARASRFWALGEMVRGRCRPARDRRRGDDARRRSPRRSPSTSPTRRSGAGSSRPSWPCSGIETGRRLGAAVRRLAHLLRAARGHRRPSSWSSRTSTAPTRACSTSSTTCSSGAANVPIYVVTLVAARSCSSGGPTGAPASATSPRSTSSRCPSRRCASCSPGSCPGLPEPRRPGDRRPRRRHPAVRGRDGPDARSPRAGSALDDGAYRPGRRPRRRSPSRRR